jgi:general secretion pathway protein G
MTNGIRTWHFPAASARRGFSLVELMVVVVILGILATVVTVRVMQYVSKARVEKARVQMREIMQALDLYKMSPTNKDYPESLDLLVEKTEEHPDGLLPGVPKDPWGNDFEYVSGTEHGYDLICYGRDGEEGGEGEDADVNSWDLAAGGTAPAEETTTTTSSGSSSSGTSSAGETK